MKKCSKCGVVKALSMFSKMKRSKDGKKSGIRSQCKDCINEYSRSEKRKEKQKIYEQSKKRIEFRKEHAKNRWKTDSIFKLRVTLRSRLNKAVNKDQKAGSAVRDLGCTIAEFKIYLEKQFTGDMKWENHGEWHIDHILPLAAFDLTEREQLLKACHYTNLQPLWAKDNLTKGSRIA